MLITRKVKENAIMDMYGDSKKTLLHMIKELHWKDVMEEAKGRRLKYGSLALGAGSCLRLRDWQSFRIAGDRCGN